MKMTKEIQQKITDGDPISDVELDIAIKFYTNLEASLKIMGEKFHFAWREAFDRLNQLSGYKLARQERIEREQRISSK